MTRNTENDVPRRTVVQGAAWSLPVLASSLAVPMASASTFACPELGSGAAFTVYRQGTVRRTNEWTTPPVGAQRFGWVSLGDNISYGYDEDPYIEGVYDLAWTFTAQAGASYTFTFDATGQVAMANTTHNQRFSAQVATPGADAPLVSSLSYLSAWPRDPDSPTGNWFGPRPIPGINAQGEIQLPMHSSQPPEWSSLPSYTEPITGSLQFTAPATGAYEFRYRFVTETLATVPDGNRANHDVWVSAPLVTCSAP